MCRTLSCSVVAFVVAGAALAAGAQPAAGLADKSGGRPALTGELAKAVELIKTSPIPSEVNETYRTMREKFPNSPELYRAYMIRVLKYGVIPPAQGAADKLVLLDPYDGLAWAVKTYVDGKAGRYPQALENAVLAAKYEPGNPSVLTAMGQLLAWHENTAKVPELSSAAARILTEIREKLNAQEPFSTAYAALVKAYADAGERRKGMEERLAALVAESAAVDGEYRALGKQLDDNNREIATLRAHINRLRGDIYNLTHQPNPNPPAPRPGGGPPPAVQPRILTAQGIALRDSLYLSIRADEDSIRDINTRNDNVNRSRAEIRVKAKKMKDEYAKLTADIRTATEGINKLFRWDPPAVDGVVTPAKNYFPVVPGAATGSGSGEGVSATSAPAPAAPSVERGERDFKLAQLHVDNGRVDLARGKLEAIIAQYPDTPLAAKAQKLLDSIK